MDSPRWPDWRRLLVLYWITSLVEGIGVAQIYAFMPTRLSEVGMSDADIGHVLGLLFSSRCGASGRTSTAARR
jgi:hypothetical protein